MVKIVKFRAKHMPLLLEMLKSQNYLGISTIELRTLPKIGYIAMMSNQPIAAGFLRKVEPCYAQLDTLCSNSHFGSAIRHAGVSLVVDMLTDTAKSLKLEGIIATTMDNSVLLRAKSLGFHVVEQVIIALPL